MDDEHVDHSASHLTPEMLPPLSLVASVENPVDGEVHAASAASPTQATTQTKMSDARDIDTDLLYCQIRAIPDDAPDSPRVH